MRVRGGALALNTPEMGRVTTGLYALSVNLIYSFRILQVKMP